MKKCRFCAEEIQDEAVVCPHCRRLAVTPEIESLARSWNLISRKESERSWSALSPDDQRQLSSTLALLEGQGPQQADDRPKQRTGLVAVGCLVLIVVVGAFLYLTGKPIASVRTARSSPLTSAASPTGSVQAVEDKEFKVAGSRGIAYFVLASPRIAADRVALERRMRTLCRERRPDYCEVMVWTDPKRVPTSFPMSDRQSEGLKAVYNRNVNTGFDCFMEVKNGVGLDATASPGCK